MNKVMRRWPGVVIALYFVSGLTALAYQVLWARMLALQFGVSIFGVVVTVAAFMLGLGVGSLIGARWRFGLHPLFSLALLEAGVALFAVSIPFLFDFSGSLLRTEDLSLTAWYAYEFVAALVLLMLPATLLGIGFPLVLRALSNSNISLGTVYGVNALGGVVGALIPLALLPSVGWVAANYSIAALGFFLAVFFLVLSRHIESSYVDCSISTVKSTVALEQVSQWKNYLAYAGVGAAALMLEVAWTRLFGMILLRTEYVLAVILAVFLLGIGLGSLLAKRLLLRNALVVLPVVASFFAILSLWGIPFLASWVESSQYASLTLALLSQGLLVVLLTAPVTLVLGMWLPVLSRHLEDTMPLAGAKLYGVNSLGAALGACLAGFVMIPLLGTTLTICFAAILLFVSGMYWAASPRVLLSGLLLLLFAFPVAMLPQVNVLLPNSLNASSDVFFYEDAVSITHVVERQDGQRLLLGDLQRMDASSEPSAVVAQQNQARLPLLLHGEPRSLLFLGVGTGISASGSLPFPRLDRVGVELSAGAIYAAEHWFAQVNHDISSKMRVVRDDVRRFLQRETKRYDVIIGDLFHPDLVGRSALLSVEQFQRVRARLTPADGLYVQWLALNQFDVASLQVILRTFHYVFPEGELFLDGFRLALV
ncbi:Spermidine synthase long, partial [hydrothermal vent metagenome]